MDLIEKYFYGMLGPSDEEAVRNWLISNSEDPQVKKRLGDIILTQEEENQELSGPAFSKVSNVLNISKDRRKKRRMGILRWASVVAAALLLPVAGAFFYSLVSPASDTSWQELKVPYGEIAELVLSDGSHLYLNSGSRVTYPLTFSGDERRIFVEGEIFADVAKNQTKPFHINSGEVDIEVLGTRFNFKSYDSSKNVEVLLLDGSLQVDVRKGERLRKNLLTSGEMLQYDRETGEISLQDFDKEEYVGFYDSRSIHFFNLSLGDIVEDLKRTFDAKIVLLDEKLVDNRYFAWFTNDESIDQILKSLCLDGRMSFRKENGVYYLSAK